MCAQLRSINKHFNKVEKIVDDLQYSKYRIYKKLRRKIMASSNWIPNMYKPYIAKINISFSRGSFLEASNRIRELTNGQFDNYVLLLNSYQANTCMPCDLQMLNKMKKGIKSYRTTLVKNFSRNTKKNNRGNNAFIYLIDKEIETVERSKKTKWGNVNTTRNISIYMPRGFFKDLAILLFYNNVATTTISKCYLWMQQSNDIDRKLNHLKQFRNPMRIMDNSFLLNLTETTEMTEFSKEDSIFVHEHKRLKQLQIQMKSDSKITKRITASYIARQMRSGEYTYEEFLTDVKKNSEMLFQKVQEVDKESDIFSIKMKDTILNELEEKFFSYNSIVSE